jgi:hypothetical protein
MKKTIIISLFFLAILSFSASAQRVSYTENHGNTLNLGLGIGGYSGYYGNSVGTLPVFSLNYEFDVANNFTLAPFISFISYRNDYYYYHETVIPLGVKGSLYLDQLLHSNSNWDFYLAGSLGFSIVKTTWDDGYSETTGYNNVNPLFLDLHVGTEYHLNNNLGLFLDLSTGVSTIGLAIH